MVSRKLNRDLNLLQGLERGKRNWEVPAEGQSVPKGWRGRGSSAPWRPWVLGCACPSRPSSPFVLQARGSRRTSTWRWRRCGTGRTSHGPAAAWSPSTWRRGRCSTPTSRASSRSHIPEGTGAAHGEPNLGVGRSPREASREKSLVPHGPSSSFSHPAFPPDSPYLSTWEKNSQQIPKQKGLGSPGLLLTKRNAGNSLETLKLLES